MSSERRNRIWLIPLMAILAIAVLALFVRLMIGPTSEQEIDLWETPFVPGETPHSTGPDSR